MDEIATRLARQWNFEPTEELPGGWCSKVYADSDRVLKVPFQGEEMLTGWRGSLLVSGNLGPKVFEHSHENGALLMERVVPGANLYQLGISETEARELVAGMIEQLRSLEPTGMMELQESYHVPSKLASKLFETTREKSFLHGDLHHYNILSDGNGWKIIDAKGLVGDPAFEPSAFIRNPIETLGSEPELVRLIQERIEFFAKRLGLSAARVWGWSLVAIDSGNEPPWDKVEAALRGIKEVYEKQI